MTTKSTAEMAMYVHWPFCKKKCPYCDFNSHVREQVDHAAWREALLKELRYWHHRVPDRTITSIFFGGGTPSLMEPSTAAAIIAEIETLWPTASELEITLEANPTSVEAEKFRALREAGVNRLSLGIQSLQPEALTFLGREHNAEEARAAIELARDIFPRYSFDLIYALPGQSVEQWEAELRAALPLTRGHLSVYQLTIEENTAFHHAYHVQKSFTLPDEEKAALLYERTQEILVEHGMPAYEISNHAAPGQESRHNQTYWRGESYLGIGPGAHGRVDLGEARVATRNLKSPERWLEQTQNLGHGLEEETPLTDDERFEEKILMGLRLTQEGVRYDRLSRAEHTRLETLLESPRVKSLHHLLELSDGALRVRPAGWAVLNAITAALLT